MKKIHPDDFRVRPGRRVDSDKWPTLAKPVYHSQEEYQTALADHIGQLSEQQSMLYASGEDSMIKHVMSGINPQGCQVFSF